MLTAFIFVGALEIRNDSGLAKIGSVQLFRVRAYSCTEPQRASVPAIVIVTTCSPHWSGNLKIDYIIHLFKKGTIYFAEFVGSKWSSEA